MPVLGSGGALADTVILARPDVLVWYDGRADYFGDHRLQQANAYRAAVNPMSAPPGATCVIFPKVGAVGSWALTRPGWMLTLGGSGWVHSTATTVWVAEDI